MRPSALEGVYRARLDPSEPFVDRLHLRVAERERSVADRALGVGRDRESLLAIDLEILDLVQVGLRIALALNLRDSLSEQFLLVPHATDAVSTLARPLARFGLGKEGFDVRNRVVALIALITVIFGI